MQRHRPSLGPVVLAILAVVAGACAGGDGQVSGPATASAPPTPSQTAAAEPGDATAGPSPTAAADRRFAFDAPQVTGGSYDATQLSGRDVAIWFWAPW